jgi:two-component system sensor histidine kinase BaeS
MIEYLRRHLGVKLLISYLIVIVVGVIVLVGVTQLSLPGAFRRHFAVMGDMMGPDTGVGPGMLGGQRPGSGFGRNLAGMSDLYLGFRASFNDALAYAGLTAAVVAIAVSLFFSRRVVSPLRAMMSASQRIAEGHYDERVKVGGSDELAQLAERFNVMADQLEQVESMRRQLIGDVSHELRTPLTSIKGSMEGLTDGVLPATPETFEQIRREADRLGRLVDDLQELSRVEAKAYSLDLRPVSLSDLVHTTIKRLSPAAQAKRIGLHPSLPDDLPPVLADEDRMTQVLTNLVSNALNYTPEGGDVRLAAVRSGDEVQVTVSDSGIGIPAEHLPHIFDRFYRVDKSRSRNAGSGSGIGLTVAKHLVEAHGGRIWAESEGEGKGSAFTFTLPVAK